MSKIWVMKDMRIKIHFYFTSVTRHSFWKISGRNNNIGSNNIAPEKLGKHIALNTKFYRHVSGDF